MNGGQTGTEVEKAWREGRRAGFGISALVLGIVTYLSLLGAEKALLAVVLGVLAIRGAAPGSFPRRLGAASIVLSVVFMLTAGVLLIVFRDQVAQLVAALQRLS